MVINGVRYDYFGRRLNPVAEDAIDGEEMLPIAMQLDSERRSIISLKTVPWTA